MIIISQMHWIYCNKTNNLQCCQYRALIRILPDEPIKSNIPQDLGPSPAPPRLRPFRAICGHFLPMVTTVSRTPNPCPAPAASTVRLNARSSILVLHKTTC